MVYFEKSQPAPECLAIEKAKANGDYKCANVLDLLKSNFYNKCYICESKEPVTINVEHFRPHRGDKDLLFDWNNLFWSCGHCNNTKLDKYENILNCTDITHDIESKLRYQFNPFPFERPKIEALDNSPETLMTRDLLIDVYNGTTKLKTIESSNLRNSLLENIYDFQRCLTEYFKEINTTEEKENYLRKIREHLHRSSNFTAFKRGIIIENERLKSEFENYFY